jgi:hypothetical protein
MILMVKGDLMVTSGRFGNLDIRNGQGMIWDTKALFISSLLAFKCSGNINIGVLYSYKTSKIDPYGI